MLLLLSLLLLLLFLAFIYVDNIFDAEVIGVSKISKGIQGF